MDQVELVSVDAARSPSNAGSSKESPLSTHLLAHGLDESARLLPVHADSVVEESQETLPTVTDQDRGEMALNVKSKSDPVGSDSE